MTSDAELPLGASHIVAGFKGEIRRSTAGARRDIDHWHDDVEFDLVLRGTATYVLDERVFVCPPGTLIWMMPGQRHKLIRSPNPRMWVAYFRAELMEPGWREDLERQPSRMVSGHDLVDLAALFSEVAQDSDEPAAYNAGLTYAIMRASRASRHRPSATLKPMHPGVARALLILRQSGGAPSLTELASEPGIAPHYLSRLLAEQAPGCSPPASAGPWPSPSSRRRCSGRWTPASSTGWSAILGRGGHCRRDSPTWTPRSRWRTPMGSPLRSASRIPISRRISASWSAHDFEKAYNDLLLNYGRTPGRLTHAVGAVMGACWCAMRDFEFSLEEAAGVCAQAERVLAISPPHLTDEELRALRVALQAHLVDFYHANMAARASADERQFDAIRAVGRRWSQAVFGEDISLLTVTSHGFARASAARADFSGRAQAV